MLDLKETRNIYLYTNKVDMRMGIYKIEILLSLTFSPIEIYKSVFIFVSKNRKLIKIYYENEYGKWLFINKLAYSKVQMPNFDKITSISKEDLSLLLKGVTLISTKIKEIAI